MCTFIEANTQFVVTKIRINDDHFFSFSMSVDIVIAGSYVMKKHVKYMTRHQ